ncbi:MAG: serine/threonine protein kinase, partial [Actinobacteria bacterium]|nr:serine/threonine protein kinase [Actinomycetota bacterium]
MSQMLLGDRYELGGVIGRGGMAEVHGATDTRLGRDVAIKLMRGGGADGEDMKARFEDEARVAARLEHPNVVAVYDTGIAPDGRPFIVMERLPGETLGDRMRAGPLPEPVVRSVADDVLAALAAAHAAGIVHRDIKPGNILLTEDGRAKIADFGIARESDSLLVDPTSTNALTGTPAYLAPERVDGHPATARSDIWALGVVLYEALAGRKPFDGPNPLAVAMAVRDDNAPPLTDLNPAVDPVIAAVVETAMARDPAGRFATAVEMRTAMRGDATASTADTTLVAAGTVVDPTVMLSPPPSTAAAAAPLIASRRPPVRALALAGA